MRSLVRIFQMIGICVLMALGPFVSQAVFSLPGTAGDVSSLGGDVFKCDWVSPDSRYAVMITESGCLRFVEPDQLLVQGKCYKLHTDPPRFKYALGAQYLLPV